MSPVRSPEAHSRSPSQAASLSNDSVHLWNADLGSAAEGMQGSRRTLSREERARAVRFRFARDRERFLAARRVLREILTRYLNTTPSSVPLRQATSGKPFLVPHGHLRFNISHAGSTLLVAVARERELGVDVEWLDADVPVAELAETTLSKPERRILDGLDGERRKVAFLAFWTRKEALVKADGRGLSLPLSDVDVSDPAGRAKLWDDMMGRWTRCTRWLLQTPVIDAAHVAAVAAEGRDWHIARRRWPGDLAGTRAQAHGGG